MVKTHQCCPMLGIKCLVWVAAVYSLPMSCTARCLFGTSDSCAFKCHCKKVTECNAEEVTCPGGCASDILGYNWTGPACQIGNVAYQKQARLHGNVIHGDASKVVDGQLEPNCANIGNYEGSVAQWSVDLGYQYRVLNITIHFSETPVGPYYDNLRNHFTIRVSSSSPGPNTGVVCVVANSDTAPPPTYTISCPDNTVGRYVYYSRISGVDDSIKAILCEVLVFGYKPTDCSRCPDGVPCSDVTGCKSCHGSYRPDCKQACDRGFYGTNCQETCGNCKSGTVCNSTSGVCPSGCKQWWALDLCLTNIKTPEPPNKSPFTRTISGTSVYVEWVQVTVDDDIAKYYGYEIRHKISEDKDFVSKVTSVPHLVGSTRNNVIIKDLDGFTSYEFAVYPYREWDGKKDYGSQYDPVTGRTGCTEPAKPIITSVKNVHSIDNITEEVQVTIEDIHNLTPNCDNLTEVWLQYRLQGYNIENSVKQNLTTELYSFEPGYEGTYLVWITVENNGGLNISSDVWNITVNGPSPPPDASVPKPSSKTIIIAVVVSVICLVLLVIIVVYCVRRKRLHKEESSQSHYQEEEDDLEVEVIDVSGRVIEGKLPQIPPRRKALPSAGATDVSNGVYQNFELQPIKDVSMDDFEEYYKRRMDTDQFVEEYSSLPSPDLDRCSIATSAANIKYNRYRKIYPYDDTRVILHVNDKQTETDYINGSFITGYQRSNEYISTQGPFDTTVVDFWRMVWQEGCNRIVMVANLEENGKVRCSQYWPEEPGLPATAGLFTLTTESVDVTVDYTTTKITVKKNDEIRTVYHFHFTSWADKNKPRYGATTLIAFFRKVHSFDDLAGGPLVVHCSAGIGRTGTFIALDILQKQAVHEGKLNVYNCVKKLRNERMLMVQTRAQYVFMHKFLVEFIKSGFTSYNAAGFQNKFRRLCDPDPELGGLSLLERQFEILCEMKDEVPDSRPKDGLLAHNRHKNRDLDIVPNNEDRPRLPGKVRDDYINAVFVDSFSLRNFYVATQMPLPETVTDFWRLVYKLKTRSIIMLNQFDNTDPSSKPYWPSKEVAKQTYGPIEVTLVNTDNGNSFDCICTRDFLIKSSNSKKPQGRTLRQFQLLTWPNLAKVPPNKEDILKLISLTEDWQGQYRSKRAGNTIVHCLNGGRQSGVFCGVTFVLEKLKSEQQIDAFLAVRYVTRRRPQFFQSKEEYKFLHEVALAAVEGDTHENIPQTKLGI